MEGYYQAEKDFALTWKDMKQMTMTHEEAIEVLKKKAEYLESDKRFKAAVETLIPELKESEDERTRKEIIEYLKLHDKGENDYAHPMFSKWFAYLEKQKEPVVDKEGLYYYLGGKFIYCGYPATEENPYDFAMSQQEKLKEQKDYHKLYEDIAKSEWFKKAYEGKSLGCDYEEKEQKPIEPSDEEIQRHQDELYNFKVFATKQAKEHHISFVHDFEWNNFCEELLSYFNEKQKPSESHKRNKPKESWLSKAKYELEHADELLIKRQEELRKIRELKKQEQKSAEWSEEDWKLLDEVREHIIGVIGDKPDLTPNKIYEGFLDLIDRLKFTKPQLKQEWGEEDDMLMDELESYILYDKELNDEQKSWRIKRLKSLRPPLKDREMKLKILKYLSTRCSSLEFEEVEDYLNNLRPSWKPSEEQMKALKRCVNGWQDTADGTLESLYNDLKKLI